MPAKADAYQERFWALFSAEAEAVGALWRAEAIGGDVAAAAEIRDRTAAQLDAFVRRHPDRAFRVFRPEDIEAAFVEGLPSVRLFDD
jgi:hypothetical protein